jgi:hypothetical protein
LSCGFVSPAVIERCVVTRTIFRLTLFSRFALDWLTLLSTRAIAGAAYGHHWSHYKNELQYHRLLKGFAGSHVVILLRISYKVDP